MVNVPQKKLPVINRITHVELQLLYGLSIDGAKNRLTNIRKTLGKDPADILTVVAFCSAEKITINEFDLMMKRALGIADNVAL